MKRVSKTSNILEWLKNHQEVCFGSWTEKFFHVHSDGET